MKMKEKKTRKSAAENLRFFGLKKIRKFVHPYSVFTRGRGRNMDFEKTTHPQPTIS